ncbi:sulfatase-like hydrolase/transferase [Stieleria sp. JC731]|uniref:sulfatase family protein n=1 Tax=Pirellulaceae TaxID=2691357 RepID=UPI001E37AA58|nr:sulfatase-like hydrolase/transferase [Stieleria sp. JC731]MCC9599492.1 sulfatase-like hydrolase/transferase [Stieleria sp. JC731]
MTNRSLWKTCAVSLFAFVVVGIPALADDAANVSSGSNSAKHGRPNVLIIYGDDQGSIDMGCFGVGDLKTPNMDRLASQGLRLTQMYSAAPVCSASRVGLLTGRFPARAGQPGNGDLKADEITIAETFQNAGYTTGHVGKWHLGREASTNPGGQGFQSWFGHLEGCIDNYSHFFFWAGPNRHDLWDNGKEIQRGGEYFPRMMVDRCKSFIGQNEDKPWMLYWAFNAPHYPYQGTAKWLEHYQDLPSPRREYCAFTSTMDEYIGEVLDYLDEQGLADNTIVIYQPDHGHSTETRAFGGGGNSGPYRGAKFSLFEGGIRVPSVVRYPGKLPTGETRNQFVTACDWYPTLCQWCEVELPSVHLDGKSIVDVLQSNAAAPRETFYWQMGGGSGAQWAVRDQQWKLIGNPRDTTLPQTKQIAGGKLKEPLFLIDLKNDPSEQTNLADKNPEILRRLISLKDEIQADF